MIDLKHLRADPDRFRQGARDKNIDVDIAAILKLDEQVRAIKHDMEQKRAEQKTISKEIGPEIGKLKGQIKKAEGEKKDEFERQMLEMERRPVELKAEIQAFEKQLAEIEPRLSELLMHVPQPADGDVPRGTSAEDNVQLRIWHPDWFDPQQSFETNKGFTPRTHLELNDLLGLADFERGVKMSGTRHYILRGAGALLHQAVLRFALDFIVKEHDFVPMTVPVIVREECMVGTGFFPGGHDQAYHIEESKRGAGHDMFLAGTGEVGLMGMHENEILDADALPLQYATSSTCFRREAGAAGRDTAGLYRIHQFDKVEQVVICKADEAESRQWHQRMIHIVEALLQKLELPYRLLQCCTGDLGPKNADMIDIECWMPGRGELDDNDRPPGDWGETHSASRLYDYQCRRLNMRYRGDDGKPVFCHSLNNTVLASPRILIPILEMYQNEDGSVSIPDALRPYMHGMERIEARS